MLAFVIILGCALTALTCALLRLLPEPTGEPDVEFKITYRDLVDAKFVACCLIASLIFLLLSVDQQPIWVIYSTAVLVAIACDARTTWLPNKLMYWCWAFCLLALGYQGLHDARSLLPVALGAGALWLFFLAIWRLTGSIGFGDVRLSPIVGGIAGTLGFDGWLISVLLGTAAAAVWGLIVTLARRRRPSPLGKAFPYGPGLWLGPYLGLIASLWASA